jgi:hypothetical protein
MHRYGLAVAVAAALLMAPAAGAQPTAADLVDRMVQAAGGIEGFEGLGVLQLHTAEEETRTDGTASASTFTAFVDATNLYNLRMEFGKNVVLGCHSGTGWATIGGEIDDRPQVSRMAAGTLRQRIFPLLLPFSLTMDGVVLGEVSEDEYDDEAVWKLQVSYHEFFFASPVMNATWDILVRKSDHAFLAAQFQPAPKFRQVQEEGVRYRPLTRTDLQGVTLSKQLLVSGLDPNGFENAHVRIVEVDSESRGPYEPTLFLSPQALEKLEEGIPGIED